MVSTNHQKRTLSLYVAMASLAVGGFISMWFATEPAPQQQTEQPAHYFTELAQPSVSFHAANPHRFKRVEMATLATRSQDFVRSSLTTKK